jgi:hypothetical protein
MYALPFIAKHDMVVCKASRASFDPIRLNVRNGVDCDFGCPLKVAPGTAITIRFLSLGRRRSIGMRFP